MVPDGRKRLAVKEFERAVRRDKKNASLRVALGDSYTRIAEPKKALKQYDEATDLLGGGKQRARVFAKMATCYEAGKDGKGARNPSKSRYSRIPIARSAGSKLGGWVPRTRDQSEV